MAMKVSIPGKSSFCSPWPNALLSGAPRIMSIPISEIAAAAKNIHLHPTLATITPPKSAAKPEPPHDPIDHKLMARCRGFPSQYALTNAKLAGMINAPDNPCKIRPNMSVVSAMGPAGENPTNKEPTILKMNPRRTVRTRPQRSAKFPKTTMKIPENKAVIDTAIFIMLVSTPSSSAMTGAIFNVVWANSQNANTPKIIPKSRRSLPLKGAAAAEGVVWEVIDRCVFHWCYGNAPLLLGLLAVPLVKGKEILLE